MKPPVSACRNEALPRISSSSVTNSLGNFIGRGRDRSSLYSDIGNPWPTIGRISSNSNLQSPSIYASRNFFYNRSRPTPLRLSNTNRGRMGLGIPKSDRARNEKICIFRQQTIGLRLEYFLLYCRYPSFGRNTYDEQPNTGTKINHSHQ